jgi:hypothetical protein
MHSFYKGVFNVLRRKQKRKSEREKYVEKETR